MESFGQSFWDGYAGKSHATDDTERVVIGVDFGTSNSCVAVWRADKNKVKIIKNTSLLASKTTPSLIQFNESYKGYKVGNDCDASVDHVISSLKSLLLHPESDISSLSDDQASPHSAWVDGTTLKCFDRPAGPHISGVTDKRASKTVPVEELVGFLLSYLKDCAEDYLTRRPIKPVNVETKTSYGITTNPADPTADVTVNGPSAITTASGLRAEVSRVVLGVPVNCTERSKQSLKNAAHLAGFSEVHFLAESTAAATAYGLTVSGTKHVLIFDMGGGTTDLSIMHIHNGTLTVQCTGGNNVLGGKNIDAALLELVEMKANSLTVEQKETFQDLSRAHLLYLCRQCKEELSIAEHSTIVIPHSFADSTTGSTGTSATGSSIFIQISREEFEAAVKPITDLVDATVFHTVQGWLQQKQQHQDQQEDQTGADGKGDAEKESDGFVQVNSVSPTLPVAEESTNIVSSENKNSQSTTLATSTSASTTTATTSHSIDEVVLVGGSSRVPCVRAALRRALGKAGIPAFAPDGPKELCISLNPEEVVAEGLAVRGAVLSGVSTGKLKELLMMDCINNAIGVMTWEVNEDKSTGTEGNSNAVLSARSTNTDTPGTRIFNSILHKGMPIPAKNTLRFPLADCNQKFVSLDIFEEVEECKRKSSAVGNVSAAVEDAGAVSLSDYEMSYTYHVVATADIAIPATTTSAGAHSGSAVDITFTMTADGMLQFSVVRVNDATSSDSNNDSTGVNTSSMYMLIGYIVLMFALYLFVKIALTKAKVTGVSSSEVVNSVVESVSDMAQSMQSAGSGIVNNFETVDTVKDIVDVVVNAVGDVNV